MNLVTKQTYCKYLIILILERLSSFKTVINVDSLFVLKREKHLQFQSYINQVIMIWTWINYIYLMKILIMIENIWGNSMNYFIIDYIFTFSTKGRFISWEADIL